MKEHTKQLVIEILRDFQDIPQHIKDREEELRHPVVPRDENVGGGRAQYKPNDAIDRLIITIDEDERLHKLKEEYEAVDYCYRHADDYTQKIIYELYIKRYPSYTMQGLIENGIIPYSQKTAYKMRNKFLKEVAKRLGIDSL